ncbi:hypothetical protein ACOSQ3_012174 [Xanthoceras sorbifolium]
MAKKVWELSDFREVLCPFKGLDVLDILCSLSSLFSRDQLAKFIVILWCLWGNRNAAINGVSKLLSGFFSAEMGEFLALREGLILAKSLSLSIFEAEVDASNVASAVNLSSNCCGDASFIVDDIKALCLEVGNCRCLAIPRSGNRLAYVLAFMAFSSGVDQSWPSVAKDCFFAV